MILTLFLLLVGAVLLVDGLALLLLLVIALLVVLGRAVLRRDDVARQLQLCHVLLHVNDLGQFHRHAYVQLSSSKMLWRRTSISPTVLNPGCCWIGLMGLNPDCNPV